MRDLNFIILCVLRNTHINIFLYSRKKISPFLFHLLYLMFYQIKIEKKEKVLIINSFCFDKFRSQIRNIKMQENNFFKYSLPGTSIKLTPDLNGNLYTQSITKDAENKIGSL